MVRTVEIIPEATPRRWGGTAPMMALLLGEAKRPLPNPTRKSRPMMASGVAWVPRWLNSTSPRAMLAIPAEASTREPMRSESQPLTGETTTMVSGITVSIRPMCAVLKPRNCCR